MSKIRRALISVSDKTGIVEFAEVLGSMKIEILSTGGTAKALREAGLSVTDVSEYTGFPEMLEGRLKTLHPKIHGGLLGRRDRPEDLRDMEKHGIMPIDMVVVNLYPFEKTISQKDVMFSEAIENIDIGGPTMLRAAAKNFQDVAVIVNPKDYGHIKEELINLSSEISYKTRARLAREVFKHTSRYDTLIYDYMSGVTEEDSGVLSDSLTMTFRLGSSLRYGENPHQKAASCVEKTDGLNLFDAEIIQGKEMSFNNYADTNSALMLAAEFDRPACVITRHCNPCGVALGESPVEAYVKALKTDTISAFGGVIAFNVSVDENAASEVNKTFVEVVIAPDYTQKALKVFSAKQDLRLLKLPDFNKPPAGMDFRRVAGGLLLQDWDATSVDVRSLIAVTKRQPTQDEYEGLEFAWKVCKHVKSNAVVYTFKDRTVGIGIGQTSRIFSSRAGAINALEPLRGSVVASDGFFRFRDGLEGVQKVGATAVIQPGGSVKDQEVIETADEYNIAMLFTNTRHFRH
jgi:phosphoribosylaminoimidazolecarboxamide formyltransferase/IMP cyclohydrolase